MVGEEVADVRVAGIALAQAGRVGEHAAHLGLDVGHGVTQEDAVVVALGHLAAVQAGALGRGGEHGLRLGEEVAAIKVVEAAGDLAGQLHVGQLVFTHGHAVGTVHEDVRGHEHGVAEEACVAQVLVGDLLLLFLVGGVAFQPGDGGDHGEQQAQLGVFLDRALAEDDALFGIQPGGHPVLDHLFHVGGDVGGVGIIAGQGVPVGHEEIGFLGVLEFHPVLEDAEVVTQMERPGGTHARNRTRTNSAHFKIPLEVPLLT